MKAMKKTSKETMKGLYLGVLRGVFSQSRKAIAADSSFVSFLPTLPGIAIDLEISNKGRRRIDTLSKWLHSENHISIDATIEDIQNAVNWSIKFIASKKELTHQQDLMKHDGRSLYDLRRIADANEYKECVWDLLSKKIIVNLTPKIFAAPLIRINSQSCHFKELNLSIISNNDIHAWKAAFNSISAPQTRFNPCTGRIGQDQFCPYNDLNYGAWMVGHSTKSIGAGIVDFRFNSATLLSTIICHAETDIGHRIANSEADGNKYLTIFGANGYSQRGIGAEHPTLVSDIDVGANEINAIKVWLHAVSRLTTETQQRISVACYYYLKSKSSSAEDEYIALFIALDAMFGQETGNKDSIITSTSKCFSEPMFEAKIELLYKLRCALVHGEIRGMDEWSNLPEFLDTYHSPPEYCLRQIVSQIIYHAPTFLKEQDG